ncbi:DOMON domain-containing protein FRRS1L [Onychostruthus taczanowskii]|uniref:DOMON domain-containing protein FRRS1L n=1 Tax=Onychostruthus taczanowskii TaxID=356909 RepID=UPI001B80BAA8|nr:DOMON domain-containing protein FRRS1L [Onychostruthus taczanowskii]
MREISDPGKATAQPVSGGPCGRARCSRGCACDRPRIPLPAHPCPGASLSRRIPLPPLPRASPRTRRPDTFSPQHPPRPSLRPPGRSLRHRPSPGLDPPGRRPRSPAEPREGAPGRAGRARGRRAGGCDSAVQHEGQRPPPSSAGPAPQPALPLGAGPAARPAPLSAEPPPRCTGIPGHDIPGHGIPGHGHPPGRELGPGAVAFPQSGASRRPLAFPSCKAFRAGYPFPTAPPVDPFAKIRVDDCGKTKGCFRYGKPGCNAETCDYFLSYRRIGADVEFELSADTDGWVAVGFSSDKKMGGDDVMACVHDDNGRVRIQHFYNVGQWAKEIQRNPARDEEGVFENNRVTCRFKRPVYVPREETIVDLHLSWYYLFAWGPAIQGSITRHDIDSPPVSERVVSIYKYEDIFMPSAAYQTFSSPFCLLLIVALTFYLLMGTP